MMMMMPYMMVTTMMILLVLLLMMMMMRMMMVVMISGMMFETTTATKDQTDDMLSKEVMIMLVRHGQGDGDGGWCMMVTEWRCGDGDGSFDKNEVDDRDHRPQCEHRTDDGDDKDAA